MQCKEFREVSEAYLSDELLVETNIQVFGHLENCAKCRAEFAAKRELRGKIRSAVKNADESQIDLAFENRLRTSLREEALRERGWRSIFAAPKVFLPAMAALLVAFGIGFIALTRNTTPNGPVIAFEDVTKALTAISLQAVESHKHCAMEKLDEWNELANSDYPKKALYTETVAKPIQAKFSENIEMLHAHDCIYEGKRFSHVILRKGERIVSVFVDKPSNLQNVTSNAGDKIICEKENGLQVASFQKNDKAIFVISDMSETENLSLARTLADSSAI